MEGNTPISINRGLFIGGLALVSGLRFNDRRRVSGQPAGRRGAAQGGEAAIPRLRGGEKPRGRRVETNSLPSLGGSPLLVFLP